MTGERIRVARASSGLLFHPDRRRLDGVRGPVRASWRRDCRDADRQHRHRNLSGGIDVASAHAPERRVYTLQYSQGFACGII
jgi:hypothetical protein